MESEDVLADFLRAKGVPPDRIAQTKADVYAADFDRNHDMGIVKTHRNIRVSIHALGIRIKLNELTNQSEIYGFPGFGKELTDGGANALFIKITEIFRFNPSIIMFEQAVLDLAYRNRFHPIKEALATCELNWLEDRVPRIDTWLIDYAGAEDTPLNRAFSRLFLIAGVRRVRHPGVKFDTLLVFESPQGMNKSLACKILAIDSDWFSDNLPLDAESKVVIEQMTGTWIIEFAELSGISRRDIDKVKSFLSRTTDRARPAYGRRRENVPRQCLCVGTTNNDRYLLDDENRRFWPCKITIFDIEKLERDVELLWGEAAFYESQNESITLDRELWGAAKILQDERKIENQYTDKLRSIFKDIEGIVTSEMLWDELGVKLEARQSVARARGQAMVELGFESKQWKGRTGGYGMQRDSRYYQRGASTEQIWFGKDGASLTQPNPF